jgi:hypothetical protein
MKIIREKMFFPIMQLIINNVATSKKKIRIKTREGGRRHKNSVHASLMRVAATQACVNTTVTLTM